MVKSRRKALRTLSQEKVVNIGDYRHLKTGHNIKQMAFVTKDKALFEGVKAQLEELAEVTFFDSIFALEKSLKKEEWDGIVIDHRDFSDEVIVLTEKLKKEAKMEDVFVVILSNDSSKEVVREGYEKGIDEWITRLDDEEYLAKLLSHHLSG